MHGTVPLGNDDLSPNLTLLIDDNHSSGDKHDPIVKQEIFNAVKVIYCHIDSIGSTLPRHTHTGHELVRRMNRAFCTYAIHCLLC